MRNIGFDDSSVLAEYARIANDKGWVKEAQEPTETVTFEEEDVEPITGGAKAFKQELLKALEPLLRGSEMFGFIGGPSQKVLARANTLMNAIKQIPDTTPVEQAVRMAGMLLKQMAQEDAEYKDFTNKAYEPWKALADKYGVQFQTRGQQADDAEAPKVELPEKQPGDKEYFDKLMKKKQSSSKTAAEDLQATYNKAIKYMQNKLKQVTKQYSASSKEQQAKAYQSVLRDTLRKFPNPQLKPYLSKFIASITSGMAGQAANDTQSDAQHVANMLQDIVKSGKDREDASKYYDVTDETGEQIVEKAHPGGGTKTELTHSKTDENLVETIVEQQKKDMEVAKSVPKGTYATLMGLYNQLHKMGHTEKLDGLKQIIKSIATPEDVMEYTLVSLADRLDRAGYSEAANRVDGMIKAAQEPYIDPGIEEWGGSMPLPDVGMTDPSGATWSEPGGVEMPGKHQSKPGSSQPQQTQQQSKAARRQKVKRWQRLYNRLARNFRLQPLMVDGILGPKTKAKMQTSRQHGGLRGWAKALRDFEEGGKLQGEMPLEPLPPNVPAPPAPPPAPSGELAPPAMPKVRTSLSSRRDEDGFIVTAPEDFFAGAVEKRKSLAQQVTLQQAEQAREHSLQQAKSQFLENINKGLDQQAKNLPFRHEDRGNLFKAVDRVKSRIDKLKDPSTDIREAQRLAKAYMSDLPDINNWFTDDVMFSDILPDAIDQKVNYHLDQAGTWGRMVQQLKQQAQPGKAGNVPGKGQPQPGKGKGQPQPGKGKGQPQPGKGKGKGKGGKSPKVARWQKQFNDVLERVSKASTTGYKPLHRRLAVDGILGPKTRQARQIVRQYGSLKEFEKALMERATGSGKPGEKAPPKPPEAPKREKTIIEKDNDKLEEHRAARKALSTEIAGEMRSRMRNWLPDELMANYSKLSISARRILNAIIMQSTREIVQKTMPYMKGAEGTSVEERVTAEVRRGLLEAITEDMKKKLTPAVVKKLLRT